MRHASFVVVLVCLVSPVQAGVYIPADGTPFIPTSEARQKVIEARVTALDLPNNTSRARRLRLAGLREQTLEKGLLSGEERLDLSGCYLSLGKPADALRVLMAGDRDNFLVQSQLAATYFQLGQFDIAGRHQERALVLWPQTWAGWSDLQLGHYRDCERYLLRLYRSRESEARLGRSSQPVDIDPIFPGLRFIGPNGVYEAGSLSWEMRDRLPSNAFAVVFQLNLWFPADRRLYWFLGEILNVGGEIDQAAGIFSELAEEGMLRNFRDLAAHRRELRSVQGAYRALKDPVEQARLLAVVLTLQRVQAPAGMADAASVAGKCAMPLVLAALQQQANAPDGQADGTTPPPIVESWPFNPRHIAISFVFGFLAALLLAFQWSQWRRKPTVTRATLAPVVNHPPAR